MIQTETATNAASDAWKFKVTEVIKADGKRGYARACMLCNQRFVASSKHILYCSACRRHNERYRYADWFATA